MVLKRVWIIPLFTFIFSISAFILSYCVAVSENHVTAFWPYISDTGTLPPESCIFGQLLNLAALFLAITVYLRHRQLIEFYWHHLKQKDGNWRNYCSVLLWLGYLSAFGVSMVGNFQEINILLVHYTGALLAFGCGLVYIWAQTVFSYRMQPMFTRVIVPRCRLLLCCLSSILFVTMIIFGPILGKQPKDWHKKGQLYKWTPETPHYVEHVIGTCSEWLLAICFQIYILSFAIELRNASCHAPKLKLNLDHCNCEITTDNGTASPVAQCFTNIISDDNNNSNNNNNENDNDSNNSNNNNSRNSLEKIDNKIDFEHSAKYSCCNAAKTKTGSTDWCVSIYPSDYCLRF